MKQFKLVVTLALLAMLITATAFAGTSKGKVFSNPVAAQQVSSIHAPERSQSQVKDAADIEGRPAKAAARTNFNMSKAVPTPSKIEAALSPKIKQTYSGGLSGTYHIPGDFTSIGAAVAVVDFVGLAGNTVFELDAVSYTEPCPMTFGSYPGNGTYTLTVKPGAGVATTINLLSSTFEGKGFAFNGAGNITIDGLNSGGSSLAIQYAPSAVFPDSDAFGSTIYMTGGSQNIAVQNASIQGIVNDPVWANQSQGRSAIFIYTADADPNYSQNITFDHLTITNATYGIKVLPESPAVSVYILNITNCNIGGAFGNPVAIGGFYEYPVAVNFAHNIIDGSEFLDWYWNNTYTEYDVDVAFGVGPIFYNLGQSTASHFIGVDAGVFHDNIIRNVSINGVAGEGLLTYGTRVSQGNDGLNIPAQVYNNRIYNLSNPGGAGSQINGIRGTAGHVYHNSIQITGALASASLVVNCVNGVTDAYNNAFEMSLTGGSAANRRAIASGGTIDYNAVYTTGTVANIGNGSSASAAAAGVNVNGTTGPINFTADLHLNAAGPSSAENAGKPRVLAVSDIDGDGRDTTGAGVRDCGADEVSAALSSPWTTDVAAGTITSPSSGGVPTGLAQTPVLWVKNNSIYATGAFGVEFATSDGYDTTVQVSLAGSASQAVTFAKTWTPAAGGSYTLTGTTHLTGDVVSANDVVTRSQLVQDPVTVPAITGLTYEWETGDSGWTRAADFVRDNAFTKLGGPTSGYAMVTENPLNHALYTEGAYANTQGYATTYPGPNLVISPWFNLTAYPTDAYISFKMSINTEPGWDGGWVDYTTDGVNWHHLGNLNDADGINWYSSAVYANAQSYTGDPPDSTTMKMSNYNLYGPGTDNPTLPMPWWTSNGNPGIVGTETGPQGPDGWIFVQMHMTAARFPDIVGKPLVKFRYVAFADAVASYAGWAIDHFVVGPGASFSGGTITGTVYHDINGNGTQDGGDLGDAATKVYLSYFGVLKDSMNTDGTGLFSFNILTSNSGLPGEYELNVVKPGFSIVGHTNHSVAVNHPSDGSTITQNIGTYQGSIAGVKWEDDNEDGILQGGEAGRFQGFKIEARVDSVKGAVAQTVTTDVTGAYTLLLPPGTYYLDEIQDTILYKQTYPPSNSTVLTISGPDNTPSGSTYTGINFGNFKYAQLRVRDFIDINGNGIQDGGDVTGMPGGVKAVFVIMKGVNVYAVDTIGNGATTEKVHNGLEAGTYTVSQTLADTGFKGWVQTHQTGNTFVVTSGAGLKDTALYLAFKLFTISGNVYNDLNGNSAQNGGELGAAGWTVTVSGSMVGGNSVVTDASGNFTIDSVAGGAHTVTDVVQPGWTVTQGTAGYTFTSNYISGNVTGELFGVFKNVSVSGLRYRDRNHNAAHDAGEEAEGGDSILATGTGGVGVVTAGDGTYMINGLGPGSHTISEVVLGGVVITQPVGSTYTFTASSGTNVTAFDFGNFHGGDSTYYRSFTKAEWEIDGAMKPANKPTIKKPTFPNQANLLLAYFDKKKGLGLADTVGIPSTDKTKPYMIVGSYKDFQTTFWKKGVKHSDSTARGFDFYLPGTAKAKVITGKLKLLTADKQNNALAVNLLALGLNINLSKALETTLGLGSLVYNDKLSEPTECTSYGFPLNGKSVSQIKAIGDNLMTNWQFVPSSCYQRLLAVVKNINAAFYTAWTASSYADVDSANWWGTSPLFVKGKIAVLSVGYLTSNPNAAPENILVGHPQPLPKAYALYQNYPNPFNPTTTVEFDLPDAANVTLKVYNILGQEVATLLNHQAFDGGNQSVDFDASRLASGVYLYRIVADRVDDNGISTGQTFTQVKKMVLMK